MSDKDEIEAALLRRWLLHTAPEPEESRARAVVVNVLTAVTVAITGAIILAPAAWIAVHAWRWALS